MKQRVTKRDSFIGDDMTLGERVAAMTAGCLLVAAFMLAAVLQSVWGDDDL